jgi:hypothetical protein
MTAADIAQKRTAKVRSEKNAIELAADRNPIDNNTRSNQGSRAERLQVHIAIDPPDDVADSDGKYSSGTPMAQSWVSEVTLPVQKCRSCSHSP